jgi:hypothetical protein
MLIIPFTLSSENGGGDVRRRSPCRPSAFARWSSGSITRWPRRPRPATPLKEFGDRRGFVTHAAAAQVNGQTVSSSAIARHFAKATWSARSLGHFYQSAGRSRAARTRRTSALRQPASAPTLILAARSLCRRVAWDSTRADAVVNVGYGDVRRDRTDPGRRVRFSGDPTTVSDDRISSPGSGPR